MAVRLLFFAQCAQWTGMRELEAGIEPGETVAGLVARLPELAQVQRRRELLKVAVNRTLAGFDARLSEGDEVAFLPPVSGG